jgi:glycosyltransferase involved in cell wall biosynthesis
MRPRITVVTASFNSAATIADTLHSVQQQAGAAVEHLVIDGGSTDGTQDIVRGFRHVAGLVSEPDHGIYDALNKGIARAGGDVVGFLHTDDVYAGPWVLQAVAEAFEDPAVEAVHGDLVYVRKSDLGQVVRTWRAGDFAPAKLRRGWMPPHPTLYVRREVYQRVGGFDTRFRIAADYECVLRIFTGLLGRSAYLPRVLVRMRLGGASNRSLGNIARKSAEDLRAVRMHGIGGAWTVVAKNLGKVGQFVGN